jgi:phytoene dehydrogenase-like protein
LELADRERLGRHVINLDRATIKTAVLSPADLERHNVNLVGGDPYSGACTLGQFHLWRPFPGSRNHRTVVSGLYHIGASTHPGPGLGGMSGYLAAQDIH